MTDSEHQPRLPRMSRRRGRRLAATLTALVIVLAGGYAAACALAVLPEPTVELTGAAEQRFAADPAPAQAAVDAESEPTAVGWLEGEEVWTNSDEAVPIASISKLVTVLVGLEQEPVEAGADGPVHVWTDEDRARQEAYLAADGIAFPIPVGTEVPTRQMLTLALIPSANDFAAAYAYSVFGSEEAFIAAVNEWKGRQGLDSLVLFEPTGMDERNAASPSDVLRIARLALQHPTIAEFTAMQRAELPWGIGVVESTNLLFDVLPDVRGVKTGRTDVAGYNLAAAQASGSSGRDLVHISVVLARDTEDERIRASVAALGALEAAPQTVTVVAADEEIGAATTVDGKTIPLVSAGASDAIIVPGESAVRTTELVPVSAGSAGQAAGTILVQSPGGGEEVAVLTAADIVEPDYWWRLGHPGELFGWS